ncbi:MAG TPA: hypothetical protein VNI84_17935 [Pyrinomonadaceae bacterium]|nr:hypothetical protein [Pyrinomonadaceae bacterium]
MTNKWKKIIFVNVIVVLFITVGTTLIIHSQKQDEQNNSSQINRQNKDERNGPAEINRRNKDIPFADFNEPLPSNHAERTKREKKNKARNIESEQPDDARRFRLTDEMESHYGTFSKHGRVEPAIPAKRSDAVIVGEVTDAKAYLSEDKVSIYSEFEVGNPEVLKNTTPESLSAEKPAVVSREGGGVRFPSGKIIYEWVLDRPMPQTGKKYIFFLNYSNETGLSIITAYELREDQVFPLDGVIPNGSVTIQFAGHQSFKGASETDFLNRVKVAIENNSDVFKREE